MTRQTLWAVRVLMIVVVIAVAIAVRVSLVRRESPPPTPSPSAQAGVSTVPTPGGEDTWLTGFEHQRFDADGRGISIKAKTYRGQPDDVLHLRDVGVDFTYTARGVPGKTHVTADEATMTPRINKGDFKGHVMVTTQEGFQLSTEQLIYRGDKGIARTEAPVAFKRKDVSGTSRGMVYNAEGGTAELSAEAYIRIDDENVGPTQIWGGKASVDRAGGMLRFEEGVKLTHAAGVLTSKMLLVGYYEGDLAINRFQAIEGVTLTLSGGAVPGMATPLMGKGSRRITSQRLFALFRPDKTLQEVTALDNARIVMQPPSGEKSDPTALEGNTLGFIFDEQGRLTEVQGNKGASFVGQPKGGASYRMTSRRLLAKIDAATGAMKSMDFQKEVVLTRGQQKGTGDSASLNTDTGGLALLGGPRLEDPEQGMELVGNVILLETASQNLKARNNVKQTIKPGAKAGGPFGSGTAPTVVTCGYLEYDGGRKTATYRSGVLLRSGEDEIRAGEVIVENAAEGKRVLRAKTNVVATVGTQGAAKDTRGAKVQSRSQTLEYDEAKGSLTYTGDVTLLLDALRTRSPRADVLLSEGGKGIRELQAGLPVEVYQESRQGKGDSLVYKPAEKSVSILGKPASLKDLEREMQGKSLTFFEGEDRIIVDGRERGRTETLIRPKETPKP